MKEREQMLCDKCKESLEKESISFAEIQKCQRNSKSIVSSNLDLHFVCLVHESVEE